MVPQMPFSSKVFQKGPKSYIDSFTRELFGSMQMGKQNLMKLARVNTTNMRF
jgi:hypothetical protein